VIGKLPISSTGVTLDVRTQAEVAEKSRNQVRFHKKINYPETISSEPL
jgi:hypothetical protein